MLCSWRGSKLGIGETRTIRFKNGICQLFLTGGKFYLKEKELEQNDHFNLNFNFNLVEQLLISKIITI